MVAPRTAHPAFDKGCQYLGVAVSTTAIRTVFASLLPRPLWLDKSRSCRLTQPPPPLLLLSSFLFFLYLACLYCSCARCRRTQSRGRLTFGPWRAPWTATPLPSSDPAPRCVLVIVRCAIYGNATGFARSPFLLMLYFGSVSTSTLTVPLTLLLSLASWLTPAAAASMSTVVWAPSWYAKKRALLFLLHF